MPPDAAGQQKRRDAVRKGFADRDTMTANRFRKQLAEMYGPSRAEGIRHAEAFEICEYGRRPDKTEIRRLFPFFD